MSSVPFSWGGIFITVFAVSIGPAPPYRTEMVPIMNRSQPVSARVLDINLLGNRRNGRSRIAMIPIGDLILNFTEEIGLVRQLRGHLSTLR